MTKIAELPSVKFELTSRIITTRQTTGPISPDHLAFFALVDEAKALSDRTTALRALVDHYRVTYWSVVRPLQQRQAGLRRAIVVMLDDKLTDFALSAKQQRFLKRIICRAAKDFALQGDDDMRILHDKHSEETLTEIEKAQAAEAQAYFEQMMGESLDGEDAFDNIDDVLHASIERMRKQAQAREKAKEKRRKRSGKSATDSGLDALAFGTKESLRTIYRQLASALHPDRETDPSKRSQKTKLMSAANTAYSSGDLFSLLQLQMKANLSEEQISASLAADKISALSILLQQKLHHLQRAHRDLEIETVAEFVLPSAVSITAPFLKSHLNKTQRDLQTNINDLKADMVTMTTSAGLKRWLKEQAEFV